MPAKRRDKRKAPVKTRSDTTDATVTFIETPGMNLSLIAIVILIVGYEVLGMILWVLIRSDASFREKVVFVPGTVFFGSLLLLGFATENFPRTKEIAPTTPVAVWRAFTEKQVRGESIMCDAAYRFPLKTIPEDATRVVPCCTHDAAAEARLVRLTMEANKDEIECIVSLLHATCPNARIFQISRVANRTHQEAFNRSRNALLPGRKHWETFAWHGTRHVSPMQIIKSNVGFDPARAMSAAATTWFAEHAEYSQWYEYRSQFESVEKRYDGSPMLVPVKQLFLARLLVSKADEHVPLPNRIWTLKNAAARSMPAYLITYQ